MNDPRLPVRSRALAAALSAVTLTALSTASAAPAEMRTVPFAKKSGQAAAMTFTAIPATESGLAVQNPYDDPQMWASRYTEFQGGAIGSGVAVGDVDGDGLVDLYVANKTRPNQLFRQVAPFRFVDVTTQAGVGGPAAANGSGWKTGVSLADVNGDGFLDLYVCRYDAPNLLYLNDGKGRFTEAAKKAGLDLVSGSVVGAFEDYDRDGDLDVFILTNVQDANRSADGEPDHLFRNRGDGTFEEVTAAARIQRDPGRGHSASWFDYNGDGWADLYIANDFSVPDHLYRNNGDGSFTDVLSEAVPHTTWFSMGSDSSDINNDGLPDLLVAEMAFTTHYKSKVAMGDMGGLVNYMDTLVTPQYMKNAVFLNSGTDRFMEVAKLTGLGSTDWSWSPRFEDLDNDGWVDLHVTNGMVRPFIDSDLLNQIKKLQSQEEIIALMRSRPPQKEVNLAFRNDGDLHFTKVQKDWGLDHDGVSFGSAFADFDNDGDLDIVYVNFDDTVSLYRNDCPSGNSLVVELRGGAANSRAIGAQVLARTPQGVQTRRLTTVRGALSSSEQIAHFGLGAATAVTALEVRWPSGRVQVLENLAAGSRYVITEPTGATALPAVVTRRSPTKGLFADRAAELGLDFVNQERVFDDMRRPGQSLLPNRMNTLGGGVAWGDANGDGATDLFFAGGAGVGSALYLNDGHGAFVRSRQLQAWDDTIEREAMAATFIDVNADGAMDLVVTSGGVESDKSHDLYRSRLYVNNGHGKFSAASATQFPVPAVSSAAVAPGDFDRDGDLDLFIGGRVVPGEYPSLPQSVLLENRNGTFVDVTDTVAPGLRTCGMVTAALWSDADGDGVAELVVTGEWMPLRIFAVKAGVLEETTAAAGLEGITGWWNSLAAADVNGDGAIDYVAGNVGHNTKYHASADHPVGIHYGDFEGNGRAEVIESEYEGDKLFPVRGRSCSSRAMPHLKSKFPTFHDWGSALLPEIYPEEKLAQALHLKATELGSGVFINDGKGRFTFRELPRIAQASPIFGLAVADFTGDGKVDIVAAQNFHGPQVETGRFDGGLSLLLVGDGTGAFRALAPVDSGIAVPGEGRGLALADWNQDGWADVVLTRINQTPLAWTNTGASRAAGRSFAVKLVGAKGNPDALGARVLVRTKDGRAQVAEIAGNAGYLSQSEPLAFFGYAEGQAPASIEVTWPDGAKTTHPYDGKTARVVLKRG